MFHFKSCITVKKAPVESAWTKDPLYNVYEGFQLQTSSFIYLFLFIINLNKYIYKINYLKHKFYLTSASTDNDTTVASKPISGFQQAAKFLVKPRVNFSIFARLQFNARSLYPRRLYVPILQICNNTWWYSMLGKNKSC